MNARISLCCNNKHSSSKKCVFCWCSDGFVVSALVRLYDLFDCDGHCDHDLLIELIENIRLVSYSQLDSSWFYAHLFVNQKHYQ